MKAGSTISTENQKTVEDAVNELVRFERVNGVFYVSLPLVYPDGSFTTVRLDEVKNGIRVSDAGFAFREAESLEASRYFGRIAKKVSESRDVEFNGRAFFTEVARDDIQRGIIDVATTSWQVADQVCKKALEDDEVALTDSLNEKLVRVFGESKVSRDSPIIGASTNEWPVSALVTADGHKTVFQAVSEHPNSIYRTATAFHDIARLESPPRLVAVVRNRNALGLRAALLAPGRIIQEDQSEELYRKAAA